MRTTTKLIFLITVLAISGFMVSAQTSTYCSTPSGHFNDPNFGDANSHILLTITNIDANNISVKVAPNTTGKPIDFLQVNPAGGATVTVGTDEGALLPEYVAIINYTTPPTNVTLEILWSNPGWGGRWMIQGLTVPFNAKCGGMVDDTAAPTGFTATKGTVTSTSVQLLLNATDNSGTVVYTISYGTTTLNTNGTSGVEKSYVVSGLSPETAYNFSIVAKDAAGNQAANNPIAISATTAVDNSIPTVAASLPNLPANKVISLFSRAYTNVGVDTWKTGWSNATYAEVQIAGVATKKYSNLVFVGIETTGANMINATAMTHFNVDVWTPDMTTFKIKLVDFGANGVWEQGGDNVEHELTKSPTLSTWNRYSIPLSDFTGLTTRAHMAQLIFSGAPAGTVYIDNVFFSDGVSSSVKSIYDNAVKFFLNPIKDQLQINSAFEISQITIRNLVGQTVKVINASGLESIIDTSNLNSGNYIVTIKFNDGNSTTQKIIKFQ